jgi:hypothetical protein
MPDELDARVLDVQPHLALGAHRRLQTPPRQHREAALLEELLHTGTNSEKIVLQNCDLFAAHKWTGHGRLSLSRAHAAHSTLCFNPSRPLPPLQNEGVADAAQKPLLQPGCLLPVSLGKNKMDMQWPRCSSHFNLSCICSVPFFGQE